MKSLLLLSLLSTPAIAASNFHCNSNPVDFTVTAPQGLALGLPLTITASGMLDTVESAQITMIESSSPPLAVVDITTLDGNGKENLESSIRARIEISLDTNGALNGPGKIQVTQVPAIHPRRMLTHYDLNNCTGNL